jgi:hypothetical protein
MAHEWTPFSPDRAAGSSISPALLPEMLRAVEGQNVTDICARQSDEGHKRPLHRTRARRHDISFLAKISGSPSDCCEQNDRQMAVMHFSYIFLTIHSFYEYSAITRLRASPEFSRGRPALRWP